MQRKNSDSKKWGTSIGKSVTHKSGRHLVLQSLTSLLAKQEIEMLKKPKFGKMELKENSLKSEIY